MPKRSDRIRIKRVYDLPARSDGTRVLVDRIWPRGMTKERACIDLWLKDIAPSSALRKWFGHEPGRWPEFRLRYRTELAANRAVVAQLRNILAKGTVSLLYGAHDIAHNNAIVLAEYIAKSDGQ